MSSAGLLLGSERRRLAGAVLQRLTPASMSMSAPGATTSRATQAQDRQPDPGRTRALGRLGRRRAVSLGYDVIKLEPTKLDRESTYGHLAGGRRRTALCDRTILTPCRAGSPGATLSIHECRRTRGTFKRPPRSRLRSTRPARSCTATTCALAAAGTYKIRVHAAQRHAQGCRRGDLRRPATPTSTIAVGGGGGGGGGKKGGGKP